MRKLLLVWTKKGKRGVRISAQQSALVSGRMVDLQDSSPSDLAKRLQERNFTGQEKPHKVKVSSKKKDCAYCAEDGKYVGVVKISAEDKMALCHVYMNPAPLFAHPCNSFLVRVFQFQKREAEMEMMPKSQLTRRAIKIDQQQGRTVFLGLLHSF